MRNHLLYFSLLLLCFMLMGLNTFSAPGSGYNLNYNQLKGDNFSLDITLGKYNVEVVNKDGVNYSNIIFPGDIRTKKQGWASVPYFGIPVQIPDNKNVDVEITAVQYSEIELDHPLLPSRGVIYRNQDPDEIPYQTDPASVVDELYPENLVEASDPYILRKVRGQNIYIHPFQYNAVQQTIRVATSITVEVKENNEIPDNPLAQAKGKVNVEMGPVYESMFVNYNKDQTKWSNEIGEFGDVLVIYTSDYSAAIQPWIEWKQQKGYQVDELEVSTGTNVVTNIQDAYDANNNLLYVLLVGDWADIQTDLGTSQNAPTDPMAGCVAGGDDYADIIVGRFSAESAAGVTAQVDKTIAYESNPDAGANWYTDALGIASDEGAGAGDDGEIDYDHISNIHNDKLLASTYDNCYEEFAPGASATNVDNYINDGISVINYCGHGDHDYWVTSGYSATEGSSATNGNKLPFIFSTACIVGEFHSGGDCLAESLARNSGGGSLISWMSTINQPWQPPMRGQDYANDLVIQGYDYNSGSGSGTSTTYGRTTFGSITFNAGALMLSESSGSDDWDTYKTWTIFGDPSVQIRTDQPKDITISNMTVTENTYDTQITVLGSGFEGAIVSLWQSGSQPASAITDASGNVSIDHNFTGTVKLTVTGFNLDTYSEDQTVVSSGPIEADFEPSETEIDIGDCIDFQDQSTGGPTSWSWTFDGATPGTSTDQNPTDICYDAPGVYDVILEIGDGTDTDTDTCYGCITVGDPANAPMAGFFADNTVIPEGGVVTFTDTSVNGPYTEWAWTFEGGLPDVSESEGPVSVAYMEAGVYDVELRVKHENSNTYIEYKQDYITVVPAANDPPEANFIANYTVIQPGEMVDFHDISSGAPYQWEWTFEGADTETSEEQHPDGILYPNEGQWDVTMIAKNSEGNDTVTKENYIIVSQEDPCLDDTIELVADFTASPRLLSAGQTTYFEDLSTGYPQTWNWVFPGGNPPNSTQGSPISGVEYNTPGIYDVTLSVNNSCSNDVLTKEGYIYVFSGPVPKYCDTLTNLSDSETAQKMNAPDTWGFIAGHNGERVSVYADYFDDYSFSQVESLIVPINNSVNGSYNSYVRFYIWEGGTEYPVDSNLLAEKQVYIRDLPENYNSVIHFDNPVEVDGPFFVGFKLYYPDENGDGISDDYFVVSTAGNRGTSESSNSMVVKKSGSWMTSVELFNIATSLAIKPVACLVDIDEIDTEKNVHAYPNPTSGKITVELGDEYLSSDVEVKAYDMTGRQLSIPEHNYNNTEYSLDFSNKSPGMYFLEIMIDGEKITKKISVMR
ncbi:MAG: C25 family cysteine peptidase [Bacteroidales bacterium]